MEGAIPALGRRAGLWALSSEGGGVPPKQTLVGAEFRNSPSSTWCWHFLLSKGLDLLLKSVKTRVVVPNAVFLLIFTSVLGLPKLLQGYFTKLLKAEFSSFLSIESGRREKSFCSINIILTM